MPRQQNVKPENYNKPLPSRLRALLEEKSLRPEDIAKATGSTRQSINYYKNGDRVPDADMLAKISKYLGVSSDYLLGLSDTKSLDESIQAAAKLTGLSGDAVNTLSMIKDTPIGANSLNVLNLILHSINKEMQTGQLFPGVSPIENACINNLLVNIGSYIDYLRIPDNFNEFPYDDSAWIEYKGQHVMIHKDEVLKESYKSTIIKAIEELVEV